MNIIDMTGQRFGKLTVLRRVDRPATQGVGVIWVCRCSCGKEVEISGKNLRYGVVKSCGHDRGPNDEIPRCPYNEGVDCGDQEGCDRCGWHRQYLAAELTKSLEAADAAMLRQTEWAKEILRRMRHGLTVSLTDAAAAMNYALLELGKDASLWEAYCWAGACKLNEW